MTITAEQIRAARALLDWSTADLARQAEMTVNGINKIERGHVQAHRDSLEKIQAIFEAAGVEFLDNNGVRIRPEGVEVLNGPEGLKRFFDLVFSYTQTSGGIIQQNGIMEKLFDRSAGDVTDQHRKRMADLIQTRSDIFVRAILEHGDNDFVCTNYADYRWHAAASPPPIPYYIFGSTVGIFTFDAVPAPKIVLITSPTIADAYRKQFDHTWNLAVMPPSHKDNNK